MNKETKIGLLVGLSFIVLFGVILNNRAPDATSSPARLLDLPPRSHSPVPVSLHLPTPPEPTRAATRVTNLPGPASIPFETINNTTLPSGNERLAQTTLPGAIGEELTALTASLPEVTPEIPLDEAAVQDVATPAVDPAVPFEQLPPGEPAIASAAGQPGMTRYIVKPGDSLIKIARVVYGNGSRQNIDRIFLANKDKLRNANTLAAGTELQIPAKAITRPDPQAQALVRTGMFESVTLDKPNQPNVAGGNAPAALPLEGRPRYQIQKGDTWYSIAERVLGEGGRWKELYELNKDILPDTSKIRPGVKIRLPAGVRGEATASLKDQMAAAN